MTQDIPAAPANPGNRSLTTAADSTPSAMGEIVSPLPLPASTPTLPRKMGRPSIYTPALGASICDALARGLSTREIAALDGMPNRDTIYTWLYERVEFSDQWSRAREASVEAMADETREIVDDDSRDVLEDQHGRPMPNMAAVKRGELRVRARQWLMGKWNAKRYGDKQQVEHSGSVTLELGSRLDTALRYRSTAALIDVTPDTAQTQSAEPLLATPDASTR